ncbi:hypothetical protein R1T43_13040 [Alteromonas sp. CI.11.F.A3]|uniref:hypothetical protein n=1 Tax=Alteromonas sp. CI.11.F.A3 TaxID=3079555 RepID=UPI002941E4F1|nr:hypothetical protein [Alteromonas sp. CI.11.F.A3]WOI36139.1 hypothetical protein R1T43_13040 [Alteromonas sp. CI.11.F.A3]
MMARDMVCHEGTAVTVCLLTGKNAHFVCINNTQMGTVAEIYFFTILLLFAKKHQYSANLQERDTHH